MAKALIVKFTLRPGHAEGFDKLVARTVTQIRANEPGTLAYVVHTVAGRPNERIFYELYRDEDAFREHETQPHTRQFLQGREQYLETVSVDYGSPLTGTGIAALDAAL